MFPHCTTDSLTARVQRNHERCVGNVRSTTGLVRSQNISACDFSGVNFRGNCWLPWYGNAVAHEFLSRDVGACAGRKPVCERVFTGDVPIKCIGLTRSDDFVKDFQDRVAIGLRCRANFHCCKSELAIFRANRLSPGTPSAAWNSGERFSSANLNPALIYARSAAWLPTKKLIWARLEPAPRARSNSPLSSARVTSVPRYSGSVTMFSIVQVFSSLVAHERMNAPRGQS